MPRKHLMLTSALALAMAALALQGCNQQTPASQQAAQPITGARTLSLCGRRL
jgi:ABC-type oligopeptide transport system substrate-binding subunit